MHYTVLFVVELLIGVALVLAATVIVQARIHKARMKQLDARYSPLPEFELDNYYSEDSSSGWHRGDYAHLSRVAGL